MNQRDWGWLWFIHVGFFFVFFIIEAAMHNRGVMNEMDADLFKENK